MHGAVLRRLGRFDDAEKVFRSALDSTPDNTFLRNNFANLLIDQQSFDEAESILKDLLKKNPDYEDAKVNLNRLNFQRNLAASAPSESQSSAPTLDDNSDRFIDPLIAAFSDEEVALAGGVASKDNSQSPLGGLQLADLQAGSRT